MNEARSKTVKILIEGGHVTEFAQIFDHIAKTAVAEDLGIHFNRMKRLIANVNDIKVNDIYLFGGYFDVDPGLIFALIKHQREKKIDRSKRK